MEANETTRTTIAMMKSHMAEAASITGEVAAAALIALMIRGLISNMTTIAMTATMMKDHKAASAVAVEVTETLSLTTNTMTLAQNGTASTHGMTITRDLTTVVALKTKASTHA